MRAVVTARSMFAFWMSGIEDQPDRSGEICVVEVFGSGVHGGTAEIGMGVHRFRDPTFVEEFCQSLLTWTWPASIPTPSTGDQGRLFSLSTVKLCVASSSHPPTRCN
jgi:hypothetical protein